MYNKYGFDIRMRESTGEPYCRVILTPKLSDTIRRFNNSSCSIKINDYLSYYNNHSYRLKLYLEYDPYDNCYILQLEGSVIRMLQFRYDYENTINMINR